MKGSKTNYQSRMVGQNCQNPLYFVESHAQANRFSRTTGQNPMYCRNPHDFSPCKIVMPGKDDKIEDMESWGRLRKKFSNPCCTRSTLLEESPKLEDRKFENAEEDGTASDLESTHEETQCCTCKQVKDSPPGSNFNTPRQDTSTTGVQVNMFHCKDCRRHIKYGKKFENTAENGTASDSETTYEEIHSCSSKEMEPSNEAGCGDCGNCDKDRDSHRIPDLIKEVVTNDDEGTQELKSEELSVLTRLQRICGPGLLISPTKFILLLLLIISPVLIFTSYDFEEKLFLVVNFLCGIEPVKEPTYFEKFVNLFLSTSEISNYPSLFTYFT